MKLRELISLLERAASCSAYHAMERADYELDYFSKSQAYRLFGRTSVDRWVREKLITTHHKKFRRRELEAVAAASNRRTYLPVADRTGSAC